MTKKHVPHAKRAQVERYTKPMFPKKGSSGPVKGKKFTPPGPTPGSTPSKPRAGVKMPRTHRPPPKYAYTPESIGRIAHKAVAHPKRGKMEAEKRADTDGYWKKQKTGKMNKRYETVAKGNPRLKNPEAAKHIQRARVKAALQKRLSKD